MNKILVYDTSIASANTGDSIIMDAVYRELTSIFENDYLINVPTHIGLKLNDQRKLNRDCDTVIVGGSNLLSSNMNDYNQWRINMTDSLFLKKAILLGVGWWQYQEPPNLYTRTLLKRVLSKNLIHSVRDEYTEIKLKHIGFENVLNTGCPTLWKLTVDHCEEITEKKSGSVVFTLTDYNKDTKNDLSMIDTLLKNYSHIHFWPQGSGDLSYLKSINKLENINVLGNTLTDFDELLNNTEGLDYIGTRLHGGIRALQRKRRTIIISIDNRAKEMGKNYNLPVIEREQVSDLDDLINSKMEIRIKLPVDAINSWRNQFDAINSVVEK
ncbi:N/A [soil metagenome]